MIRADNAAAVFVCKLFHVSVLGLEAEKSIFQHALNLGTCRPARQEDAGIIEYEEYEEYEESPRMTSYVLEDGDGHMTVVEQQSHTIPGVMA